jgi:hypothetical protein
MSEKIIEGMINYAKKEIKLRIEEESKRIVSEVITDTMNLLHFNIIQRPENMKTEIHFTFIKKD